MPNVLHAVATELRKVRVTFDGVLTDLTSGANGALNVSHWTFSGQADGTDCTAAVTAKLVEQISTSILDVTTSEELSPGQVYQVAAKPAADGGITGVPASPNNAAIFTSVLPSVPPERDFDILTMVPRMNRREDDTKDLERFLKVMRDPLLLQLNSIDRWTDVLDYDVAPDNHLDLMLQDMAYPFLIGLSTVDKRRLLSVLATMYRQAGTVAGMKAAIRFFLGYESDILFVDNTLYGGWILDVGELDFDTVLGLTWFNVSIHGTEMVAFQTANPFVFWVKVGTLNAQPLTADEEKKVRAIIDFMKPTPALLLGLNAGPLQPGNVTATPGVGMVTIAWTETDPASDKYIVFWSKTPFVSTLGENGVIDPDNQSPYVQVVPPGETRYYVVCGQLANGRNGVASPVVSATSLT